MRNHTCAQITAPSYENPIKNSQRRNDEHLLPSLISVGQSEYCTLQYHTRNETAGGGAKLLLQITAKNDFLADSGRDRKQNTHRNFGEAGRRLVSCSRSGDAFHGKMNEPRRQFPNAAEGDCDGYVQRHG